MRFGEYFKAAIARKGLSERAFGILVGSPQQVINGVIHGERTPPLARIEAWAKALEGHVDVALFVELAELEHTPPGIRKALEEARAGRRPTRK